MKHYNHTILITNPVDMKSFMFLSLKLINLTILIILNQKKCCFFQTVPCESHLMLVKY